MPRTKKDAIRLSVKLDRGISKLLDEYCEATGENKTMAIEKILGEKLQEKPKPKVQIRKEKIE